MAAARSMIRQIRLPSAISRRGTRLLSASSSSSSSSNSPSFDPLRPSVPTTELGLPVTPQPSPIPVIPHATIDRALLHRLHKLAELNPPPEGSAEETTLLEGLGELVGLMDLVGDVELSTDPEELGSLLTEGVGEFVVGPRTESEGPPTAVGEEKGRELLEYATRRVGDYYGFKIENKEGGGR